MNESAQHRSRLGIIGLRLVMAAAAVTVAVAVVRDLGSTAPPPPTASAAPEDTLAVLEGRTRDNPNDGEAWSALATGYFAAGRFDDAVKAYDSALDLTPGNAALWSARGEARVMASPQDPMPAAALADFEAAIGRDPKDPRARYFLAVRQDLAGDHQAAIASWMALLADTPPGAVWEADLRRTIEQVGKINGIAVAERLAAVRQPAPLPGAAGRAAPGPSAAELAGAAAIPPSQQRQMAEGMVTRLEGRLQTDPANVEGWVMLIRSRVQLGQPDLARTALNAAIKANPAAAERLRTEAEALGLR